MATTSPDNLRTPDSGDPYALVQDMGILADTTQNALIKRANAYVGTVAQRTAFTSEAPTGTIWSDEDGDRLVWKKGATDWEPVAPEPVDTGWVTISLSSGWSSVGSAPVSARNFNGTVWFRGEIANNTFTGGFSQFGTLPSSIPPPSGRITAYISQNTDVLWTIRVSENGRLETWRDAVSGSWGNISALSYLP